METLETIQVPALLLRAIPSNGQHLLFGEYLMNAQGEDVVAGVRTPVPISELEKQNEEVYKEFVNLSTKLERHYKDMQDLEFTIEHGKLFMLQCRSGKRTGPAAVNIAVDMVNEGLITKEEALQRVSGSQLDQLLHPRIDPAGEGAAKLLATGLAASSRRSSRKRLSLMQIPPPNLESTVERASESSSFETRRIQTTSTA